MDNINEKIQRLKFTIATSSYPALEELKYLREYNEFIEKSVDRKTSEVSSILRNESGEVMFLNLELIQAMSDDKMYNSFKNIMRTSLLMATYSIVENVVTAVCHQKERKFRYYKYKGNENNTKKNSIIAIAIAFLHEEGFSEIKEINGWDFIDDMREVRNQFVHYGGNANKKFGEISDFYDFKIDENQIILGENLVGDFIDKVENVAIEFVKIVYPKKDLF